MRTAYNETWLRNLDIVKDAKQWSGQEIISREQFAAIQAGYPAGFYHPNLIIRILLFIASLIALGGITGLLALMFIDGSEATLWPLSIIYGLVSFLILDRFFITGKNHYKSGVTEALLYHSILYIILGVVGITEFNVRVTLLVSILLTAFAAYRYIDLIATLAVLMLVSYFLFYELYELGGIFQQIIPIVFILLYIPLYFLFKSLKAGSGTDPWYNCLLIGEAYCLIVIYAAGNYLVVRELSLELMDLYLEDGQDIPFAVLFYVLTVTIPIVYLYVSIIRKDIVMLRVSLIVVAFSVFTFKYYYSLGHPEITLTAAGAFLILVTLALLHYLKTPRNGFTRENVLSERWSNVNVEAIIIAQTMGGNKVAVEDTNGGGGGKFGGGGASGEF
ncbi:MAG TPA: hypothetical protein VGK59_24185 [Ohtaekwangia sp.]